MHAALKAVLAVGGFYLAVLLLSVLPVALMPEAWRGVGGGGGGGLMVPSIAAVLAAMGLYWGHVRLGWTTWAEVGFPGVRRSPRAFGAGLALGWAMALSALLVAIVLGGARISVADVRLGGYATVAGQILVLLTVAAFGEELLFRGYPLARLAREFGKVGASAALAVVFALAHLWNPNVSVFGLINIGLAALVLSAAFFTPGGIIAAWGVHLGWNAGLSLSADAPVSGIDFSLPVLEFFAGGVEWVSGGAFGPEGGIAGTVAMLVGLGWLVRHGGPKGVQTQ